MKSETNGFRIEPGRPSAVAARLAFACCIPAQIMGYADSLNDPLVAVTLILLPVLSASLMIAVILLFGRNALWLSVFPICIGILGFAYKLAIDPHGTSFLHHVSATILYLLIIVLWALTVLYVIRTKWILVILFLAPFLKHVFVNVIPTLMHDAEPMSACSWFKEISMLFFMLALFFCAMSFDDSQN